MTVATDGRRHFASDNWAGVHPEVLDAIARANTGHATAYGDDRYTTRATEKFKDLFGGDVEVFFVFGGTAANVLGLQTLARSYNAVICASTAHIYTSECAAAEKQIGCKLLPVFVQDGKLRPELIGEHLQYFGQEHHAQPSAISISQATEYGTVYSVDELQHLADFARIHGLRVHTDGARIANAVAHLGCSARAITRDAGVDVMSFGATKNGALAAEAVVFFDRELARDFRYRRMQGMQLASKMRFIAVQFDALLSDDLWLRSAAHANRMAARLGDELAQIPGVRLTQKVQGNQIFAVIPRRHIMSLQERFEFHVWNEQTSEIRLVTAFDTTDSDVDAFLSHVRQTVAATVR